MYKEEYEQLELKVVVFDTEDVITASDPGYNDPDTPGGGWQH